MPGAESYRIVRRERVIAAFRGWLEAEATQPGTPSFRLALYRTDDGSWITLHTSDPFNFCAVNVHAGRDEALADLGTGALALRLRRSLVRVDA